ncbi:MAG TPA: phosphate ABC transporter substrate-binding protein PstS [Candidatus Dormibacteraeota bacterium]|nr:phosphate ABC transporter substrate-binding protein PstS [Candidatus Dormibacteraeota bacterium]
MRKLTAVALAAVFAFGLFGAARAATPLLETGSSLLYPLMNLWVASYQSKDHAVQITTQGTGSGTGISQAIAGVAQIGASDAYMGDAQMRGTKMLNIPLAISAQQINYNLPGLNNVHLHLSGPVLAGIYTGTIRYWNDARIKALNHPYAGRLPHRVIIPIHRTDGSGDTFIFSQYLSFTTPAWSHGPGYGTSISWPSLSTAVGANGNPGMVQACKATPYSIAYIGVSFINETNKAGLGYALLKNRAGRFLAPTASTIGSAAAAMYPKTPRDERISLVFAPGANSYPIINYEYAIVNPHQRDARARVQLVRFLSWVLEGNGGQEAHFLNAVHFLPLPASVGKLSRAQIAQIR